MKWAGPLMVQIVNTSGRMDDNERKARSLALRRHLIDLANRFIMAVLADTDLGVYEGVVMTVGPPPYRRLDCDGRALAYIRVRPRKRAVRVDVTGLWTVPAVRRCRIANAGGAATFLLRAELDCDEIAQVLVETVRRTRRQEAEAIAG